MRNCQFETTNGRYIDHRPILKEAVMYLRGNKFCCMKKSVLIVIISILVIAGCKQKITEKTESIAEIQKRDGIPVRIINVKTGLITSYELLGGTAEGYYQTTLTSGVAGKITAVNVKVGDNVNQNTYLMTIEPDQAHNYSLAKTQYETSRKSRDRVMALAEQGGVSQEIIDRADAEFQAAKENLGAMRKNQFVPAPFAGTVVNIFQTVNNKIASGNNLLTIAQIDKIRIPMEVSDVLVNKFKAGQKAVAVIGSDSISGYIEKVALSGQEKTHTFIIEAVIKNGQKIIKPGMYVPVKVIIEKKNNVIALPVDVINAQGTEKYVFLVNDSIVKRVSVKVGIRDGEMLEIVSGITEGDIVVASGASMLVDGSKIKIVD